MRSRRTFVVMCILTIVVMLGICSALGQQQDFKNGKTVWLLMPYTGEFWWDMLVTFLKEQVEKDGWNFQFSNAEGSDTMQFDQIVNCAQRADIIFLNPTSISGVNEAVRIAEEQYHTPVVVYKDHISGKARVCALYDDYEAAKKMAMEAVDWIKKKYGTTEGKTVIALNGELTHSGWSFRYQGFRWIKENHPEINFVEVIGGMTPEGWADAVDAALAGPGADAVAILAASDGPYLLGALQALEKRGKLYYVDDPNHIYVASIDGKPSTLMWLRYGYIDTVYSQTPDAIAASLWQIAKEYILKDASYQYPPYKMPEIPLPLQVKQPEGCYWGGEDLVMTIDKVDFSETPTGRTPAPRVDRNNVNDWRLWGNKIIKSVGFDLDPVPTFDVKGQKPEWVDTLVKEFNDWLNKK
jgi:ABC-type sugar transport system substrate-binding protein